MDPVAKIGDDCMESWPCQHYVVFESGQKRLMFWPDIVGASTNAGRPAPVHPGDSSLEEVLADAQTLFAWR